MMSLLRIFGCMNVHLQEVMLCYEFCIFVPTSTCESPLLVFVSINGENGDVYAAKCNSVSG